MHMYIYQKYFCHIHTISSLPFFMDTFQISTSPLPPCSKSFPTFRAHWIQLVLSICAYVLNHPLEYGQSICGHSLKEKWLSLPQQQSAANNSSNMWALSSFMLDFNWLIFVKVISANVSLCIQQSCHIKKIQKTHSVSHQSFPFFGSFLPFFHDMPEPWWWNIDIDILLGAKNSQSPTINILTSYESLHYPLTTEELSLTKAENRIDNMTMYPKIWAYWCCGGFLIQKRHISSVYILISVVGSYVT